MIPVFDIKKLREILKDCYEITKIRITVIDADRNELASYPEEIAPFCRIIRCTEAGRVACASCDREACERAAGQRRTQIYRCHAGLTEAVTPLIVNGKLLGYLFFGQAFSYPDHGTGWAEIEKLCAPFPVDRGALHDACLERPPVTQEYIRAATHILLAVASYLVMERMVTYTPDRASVRLNDYVSAHYTENLNAKHLSQTLGIGKTQLYKLSKELYGCGIAEQVRHLRMEKAKAMLLDPGTLSLAQVAQSCGYDDYNYFIAVFSRTEGCPPGEWKKRQSEEAAEKRG